MIRLLVLFAAFCAGFATAIAFLDRLLGGHGPRIELDPFAEAWFA